MNPILKFICKTSRSLKIRWYHRVTMKFLLSEMNACGTNVVLGPDNHLAGSENISIGNDVYIGPGSTIYSTKAKLLIGNHVIFGPNVTIVTGDHRTDKIGKYMKCLTDDDKLPENDKDVVIDNDVWIGTGAIILKGVHIGEGSVIAAGAIVTKDVPPYTIYISTNRMKQRFSEEQIAIHKKMICGKSMQ